MENHIQLSIILPVHNEEKNIESVLQSILSGLKAHSEKTELILIDNRCTDSTIQLAAEKLEELSARYSIHSNNTRNTSAGFNLGIQHAAGNFIMIMGGHTQLAEDYFRVLFDRMDHPEDWDVIGGGHTMIPQSFREELVHALLTSPFGVGNSTFRTSSEPAYVESVPYGTYKRSLFEEYGTFDETYVRNQDLELNLRLHRNGVKLYFDPALMTYYRLSAGTSLAKFLKKYYQNGRWIGRKLQEKDGWRIRHVIPFIFVLALVMGSLFTAVNPMFGWLTLTGILLHLAAGLLVTIRRRNWRLIPVLPLLFLVFHLMYGLGTLSGFLFKGEQA